MKKQIFRSICVATMIVFLASLLLIMGVLYKYFSNIQMNSLENETYIVASAIESSGEDYLDSIADEDYRITWISEDGTVLFDNKADSSTMENHLEREEIQEALNTGKGESTRYSTTLTELQLYCAQKLSDGTIIRLSSIQLSWWALILSMAQPIIAVMAIAILLSVFLAYRLAKRIVKPLNDLDLEKANTENTYEELSPLIERIASQKEQLKNQESILKQKKEEFDTATENMHEGIILLGANGEVLSINHAASNILKISRYCIGKDILIFNNTFEIQELLRVAAEGKHGEQTVCIDGKDYQFNASPIMTDNKVSGIALILFDITEKEKAETARREFTANVSHELKTPLQTISGSAELLANGMVKAEDVPTFAKSIFDESKRMIALIEDIIKLSNLDEGSTAYEFEKVDLYKLAELTYRNLLPIAESKDINFKLTGKSATINGIPSLLSEIMYNLCDNAIKYNQSGGSVTMSIKNYSDRAVLSVEDTGIGIAPEEQERIFERFYRVDKSRSKDVGGTGLGLSIVKHAVLVHNGEIEVSSKIGHGTKFTITFKKEK